MPRYTNLKMEAFEKQITSDPNAIVLDVRTPAEYADGHLEMAINVPNIKEIIDSLNPSKHYFLHCRVGGRSAVASLVLANRGFQHVFNLSDLIENTSLPLVKNKAKSLAA